MSYTTGTTHYNLPQTVGTDKRDWADTNQAFQDIDAAIYGAVQDTAQAASDIDALEARMDTAEQNIATNTGDIAGLDTRLTTAEGAITSQGAQITDTRQDLEDMICAFNEASATSTHAYAIGDYFIYNDVLYRAIQAIAIGDTIVPDTNCETTNVATELLAIKRVVLREIVADGIKSAKTLIEQLCDFDRSEYNINAASFYVWESQYNGIYTAIAFNASRATFVNKTFSPSGGTLYDSDYTWGVINGVGFKYGHNDYVAINTLPATTSSVSWSDDSSDVPANGTIIRLYMSI